MGGGEPEKLTTQARETLIDPNNTLVFSAVSIWEVAIKNGLGRADLQADPRHLRRGLSTAGYVELPLSGEHAVAVGQLPPIHRDPFDRILLAQAVVEGMTLLTADPVVAQYAGSVILMR